MRNKTAPVIAYTTGQAAGFIGVSIQTINRWFDEGAIKRFCIGARKHRRIPRAELLRFMLSRGIPTDPLGPLSAEERELVSARVMGGLA